MTKFRVKLDGEQAHLGRVPAADVARLLLLFEKAAAQAAAVLLRQPKTTTGRYRGVIEQAVHFRLVGIEESSVAPILELPDPAPQELETAARLDFEVITLGESAVNALLDAVKAPSDPLIAKAILDVADGMFVGERYDAIMIDAPPSDGRRRRKVKIDVKTRKRLRKYVDAAPAPAPQADDLVGSLVEADFERCTARLRTPTDAAVEVSFSDEHADDIQSALRQKATVRGDVLYDPRTHAAKSVRLTEIVRGIEQLALDPDEFWNKVSFEELAERQASGLPVDPEDIYAKAATDEERDAVLAALAELE
jgi:hypothetical protein